MQVEINRIYNPETNETYNALYFDKNLFDWGMESEDLSKARNFCGDDPFLRRSIQGDIKKFFLQSLEEFLGNKITLDQLNKAIETGRLNVC